MSNDITLTAQPGATVGTAAAIFNPEGLMRLQQFAQVMSEGAVSIPQHLRGKPADCLAVTMQAAQWGMNPFSVAQKTHVVNGALGYEAQLVNAAVSSSSLLATRLNYRWDGDWSKVNGKTDKSPGLTVTVWATLKGEAEPRELTISMAQAGVRNSPLWEQDPRQQLAYLCTKRWARLHAPDVLLGVYTPDELEESRPRVERDITPPAADARSVNSLIGKPAPQPDAPAQQATNQPRRHDDRTPDELLKDFTEYASNAASVEALDSAYKAAAKRLASHQENLDKATDVYSVRREEMTAAQ
ncbi:RecT family recombinase [Cronobacter sakazakii]|uniref:RecT family recombinase n=1 Tax=Cronobacter sakazakii TaxID=28141 RepID=UPI000CFBB461|nr:RecT family recombinase [Cronobacter sakazakii]ELY4856744.1 recombinase RecT [Cronobacter sakazakii]MDT3522684.1 RecT family recombinase [Cronobacter sakazakii]NCH13457.1 recombinase RecT [Cronobacter sakazakii]QWR82123.1 recombinase RecT [Cronobacter sakazakii]TYD51319.1 recombinase RecT [Cronobacter sakazakii]